MCHYPVTQEVIVTWILMKLFIISYSSHRGWTMNSFAQFALFDLNFLATPYTSIKSPKTKPRGITHWLE